MGEGEWSDSGVEGVNIKVEKDRIGGERVGEYTLI